MTPGTQTPAIPAPRQRPPIPGPHVLLNQPNIPLTPVILSEGRSPQPKDPDTTRVATTLRRVLPRASIAALLFAATLPIHAQGCAQCLDTTRATPPSVQAAYRHAIVLLGGFAATFFLTGTVLLRRQRPQPPPAATHLQSAPPTPPVT